MNQYSITWEQSPQQGWNVRAEWEKWGLRHRTLGPEEPTESAPGRSDPAAGPRGFPWRARGEQGGLSRDDVSDHPVSV